MESAGLELGNRRQIRTLPTLTFSIFDTSQLMRLQVQYKRQANSFNGSNCQRSCHDFFFSSFFLL